MLQHGERHRDPGQQPSKRPVDGTENTADLLAKPCGIAGSAQYFKNIRRHRHPDHVSATPCNLPKPQSHKSPQIKRNAGPKSSSTSPAEMSGRIHDAPKILPEREIEDFLLHKKVGRMRIPTNCRFRVYLSDRKKRNRGCGVGSVGDAHYNGSNSNCQRDYEFDILGLLLLRWQDFRVSVSRFAAIFLWGPEYADDILRIFEDIGIQTMSPLPLVISPNPSLTNLHKLSEMRDPNHLPLLPPKCRDVYTMHQKSYPSAKLRISCCTSFLA